MGRWFHGRRAGHNLGALILVAIAILLVAEPARALTIVAAESAFGDIARQVARPYATVVSLLTNPATDPHLYEPTPSAARSIETADVVIVNGAGYDAWADRLIPPGARRLSVAALLGRSAADNPHLCYDPLAAPALARALAATVATKDPAHAAGYAAARDRLLTSLAALQARIANLRARFAGVPVAASEPVLAPLLQAVGLVDTHARFELAMMNDAEPRASDVAGLQADLGAGRIRALITNAQVDSPMAARLTAIAHAAGVPVIPVTETLRPGVSYQDWIAGTLDRLQNALAERR